MALLYADRFQSGYICALPNGTIDAILAPDAAFPLFERLFVQKMQVARILIDKMGRLQTMKNRVTSGEWQASQVAPAPDVQGTWFWQSFTPLHIERMAQSADPLHPTAVDMMLTACLPGTWWAYFDLRGLIWQGEKAALHRALLARTIQPIDAPFNKGEMALIFEDSSKHVSHLGMTLDYWNKLFV